MFEMPNWSDRHNDLMYIMRGLNQKEQNYINNSLKVSELRIFLNIRYAPDPCRYDIMTKKELLNELKYKRYY